MFITNRDIKLDVLFDNEANCECLQWRFGYKVSKEIKEAYKRGKLRTKVGDVDKNSTNKIERRLAEIYPNTKEGARLAKEDRANAIVEFEKNYEHELGTDMKDSTFREYINVFIGDKIAAGNSSNTLSNYISVMNNFKGLWNIKMQDITRNDIQRIVYELSRSGLSKKGLKSSSLTNYIKKLTTIFKRAFEDGNIQKSVSLKGISLPKDKKNEKIALTNAESILVLEQFRLLTEEKTNFSSKYYLPVYLCIKLGMRIGETLGLTWDKINFEKQTMKIDQQLKYVNELKKNAEGNYYVSKYEHKVSKTLKTENSYREIYIPTKVMKVLEEYKLEHDVALAEGFLKPYEINSVCGFKSTNSSAGQISELLTTFGFPNVSPHNLRHTFVTTNISNGLSYSEVGSIIGDDEGTVMRIYSHINADNNEKIRRTMETND